MSNDVRKQPAPLAVLAQARPGACQSLGRDLAGQQNKTSILVYTRVTLCLFAIRPTATCKIQHTLSPNFLSGNEQAG